VHHSKNCALMSQMSHPRPKRSKPQVHAFSLRPESGGRPSRFDSREDQASFIASSISAIHRELPVAIASSGVDKR